jgi:hypothetical protein
LAITLLLAATKTFEWERANKLSSARKEPDYDPDDGPLTQDQLDQLKAVANADLPTGETVVKDTLFPDEQEFFDRAKQTAQAIDAGTYEPPDEDFSRKKSVLEGVGNMWSRAKKIIITDTESEHAPLDIRVETEQEIKDKQSMRAWKELNPTDTIKHQERLLQAGIIDQLPWQKSKLNPVADNSPPGTAGKMRGFGTSFPRDPVKGDMFLRVDQLPSGLYKFNGTMWIEVDKALSDQHAYDDAYIDHLIQKLSTGEYDPDLLSDAERASIEHKLNNSTPG